VGCSLSLSELIRATDGQLVSDVHQTFRNVSTDTRQKNPGGLFVPLKGEKFDGHDFLKEAVAAGATVILVDHQVKNLDEIKSVASVVRVADTLKALQSLARYWRKMLTAKVVGITGSNGKSTAKDFTAKILEQKFLVSVSQKSFNNHIGVPLTLLSANLEDEVVILEMGMNHAGELSALSKIATPDLVLCTMVGRAHIGNFSGSQQGVADAKEEIYLSNPQATMIFNFDNEFTIKMFERVVKLKGTDKAMVFSSFSAGAEVSLRATHLELDGIRVSGHIGGVKGEAKVPVFGRQNVVALMAASSVAYALGLEPEEIWARLPLCHTGWGRNQLLKLSSGPLVLFDAYNANPDSMSILLKNLFEISVAQGGRKIAVLGEMLELGDLAAKSHQELGELAGSIDLEFVCFVGPSFRHFESGLKNSGFSKNYIVSDTYEDSLALKVQAMLKPHDVVVMKASRGVRLERMLKVWHPDF